MFSLTKILALVAILSAVWYGFKLVGRLDEARRRKGERPVPGGSARPGGRAAPPRPEEPADGVLDLVKDENGNYVAKNKRDDRL